MEDVVERSAESAQPRFDPSQIRVRFARAFKPSPLIFWSDMLGSALLGWCAFAIAVREPLGSLAHVLSTTLAIFALLRGALFIHELAHLKRAALPGFEIGWHLVIGLPLMLPSLMYVGSHNAHHRRTVFATLADPEYAPIAKWNRLQILKFVLGVALVPFVLPIRWGILGPLSYLLPALRRPVVERLSTLVINAEYERPMPRAAQAKRWLVQETAAAVLFWLTVVGVATGWISGAFLAQWFLVSAGILMVNQLRTLAAHGYQNEGERVDALGQLLDSINLRGSRLLTALVAPVGLRYHALHHLLPTVPYHSLGGLHRLLLGELPQEAPYRRTERPGLLPTLRDLWRHSAA